MKPDFTQHLIEHIQSYCSPETNWASLYKFLKKGHQFHIPCAISVEPLDGGSYCNTFTDRAKSFGLKIKHQRMLTTGVNGHKDALYICKVIANNLGHKLSSDCLTECKEDGEFEDNRAVVYLPSISTQHYLDLHAVYDAMHITDIIVS